MLADVRLARLSKNACCFSLQCGEPGKRNLRLGIPNRLGSLSRVQYTTRGFFIRFEYSALRSVGVEDAQASTPLPWPASRLWELGVFVSGPGHFRRSGVQVPTQLGLHVSIHGLSVMTMSESSCWYLNPRGQKTEP